MSDEYAAEVAYRECDPLGLDADAMRYEDVRIPDLRAKIASMRKTLDAPRYTQFFDNSYMGAPRARIVELIGWAEDNIAKDGQEAEDGNVWSVDAAAFQIAAAEEIVDHVVERVDDWATD